MAKKCLINFLDPMGKIVNIGQWQAVYNEQKKYGTKMEYMD